MHTCACVCSGACLCARVRACVQLTDRAHVTACLPWGTGVGKNNSHDNNANHCDDHRADTPTACWNISVWGSGRGDCKVGLVVCRYLCKGLYMCVTLLTYNQ